MSSELHEHAAPELPPKIYSVESALGLSFDKFVERHARGGYLWTMAINQRIGALFAIWAVRRGLRPLHLTLTSALIGVASSIAVVLSFDGTPVLAAAIGLLGWELAYSLDCGDGQLARATESTSHKGAIADLMTDFFVQLTVLAATLHISVSHIAPGWRAAFCVFITGGWMISLYFGGVLGWEAASFTMRRGFGWLDLFRHARDYGFQLAILSLAIFVGGAAVAIVLAGIAALNFAAVIVNSLFDRTAR